MRGSTACRWRAMSTPRISTVPAVGSKSPSSIEMVVVLPAPLPPRRPVTLPRGTVKSMASTAVTSPPPGVGKRLVSPATRMAGGCCGMVRSVMGTEYGGRSLNRQGHAGRGYGSW